MLARKRGGLRGEKGRKMAKKNAPAALQTEVSTDEEWDKILQRPGLVHIYSEWSGPCTGMVSILKKVKMESGGDHLSYAIAKCDNITSLARFRGKSEPAWMFIRRGKMVNIIFGANCPNLLEHLMKELKRTQNDEPPEFSLPVTEISPKEAERLRLIEEARLAKDAVRLAKIAAQAKKKYETQMEHYLNSLTAETYVILFPWIFKDEEGTKREKKNSPPYMDLIDNVLTDHFAVEQEIKKQLDDDILVEIHREIDYSLSEESKERMTEDNCMCLRLKLVDRTPDIDIDNLLISLLYGEARVAMSPDELLEGCYVQRHMPTLRGTSKASVCSGPQTENLMYLTTVWVPLNARNRAISFRAIFTKYIESTCPYEDKDVDIPLVLFKFDTTRKKELKVVMEMYSSEVVNFGVFERDKLPDPKLIASSIEEFENDVAEKSSYEVFVCVIKKLSSEAFLSFAGIGPYYVSENQEKAIEESDEYFPRQVLGDEEDQSEGEEAVVEEPVTT